MPPLFYLSCASLSIRFSSKAPHQQKKPSFVIDFPEAFILCHTTATITAATPSQLIYIIKVSICILL